MSELNEELLNDDVDDFPDIGEADEDALLQDDDDGDVLDIIPEDELGDAETDQKATPDKEERKASRQDKFATERQIITAPEPSAQEQTNINRPGRQNMRGRSRGFRYQQQGRYQHFNQARQYNRGGPPGRNKTVLINPRFQGVVHVNNNAWDTHQQNPWGASVPPVQAGPPMQPHPQHGQFQVHMQQFQGPPQMQPLQGPMHVQPMHQGPPMHQGSPMHQGQPMHQGPPMQQMQYMHHQQQPAFMPQPLPPGVPQSHVQPTNQPALPYWDGQNQVPVLQGPNQAMMPYMQNNYEASPPPNYYNHQYNQPMEQQNFNPNQNYIHQNHPNNVQLQNNMAPVKREILSPQKRKNVSGTFGQNKKRFVQERLGHVKPIPVTSKKVNIKTENRPSVVKEVTVTNVTTVKIEDDAETRDLRLKIEEQRRKREQVLKWKELRRQEVLKQIPTQQITQTQPTNQRQIKPVQQRLNHGRGRGGHHFQNRSQHSHLGGSMRTPVLQPLKQVEVQGQPKGRGRNVQQTAQNVNQRVKMASMTGTPTISREEPVVPLDEKQLSTFLADRKVLVKDEALMSTRKVVIKNIATSTGDKKIIQICKGIGEVQKLHRDKNDRHATITFKSVASAHAFFKKYQRHMLDLSMIEVSLTPESDGQD